MKLYFVNNRRYLAIVNVGPSFSKTKIVNRQSLIFGNICVRSFFRRFIIDQIRYCLTKTLSVRRWRGRGFLHCQYRSLENSEHGEYDHVQRHHLFFQRQYCKPEIEDIDIDFLINLNNYMQTIEYDRLLTMISNQSYNKLFSREYGHKSTSILRVIEKYCKCILK